MIDFFQSHSVLCFVLLFIITFIAGILIGKISSISKIKSARKDAVTRSRAVLGGQLTEQIAPFLPEFPCNPADVRFVGKPVDFVAFNGLSEKDRIESVTFIEVKTGGSALNEHEKQLKDCIEKGRVTFVKYAR